MDLKELKLFRKSESIAYHYENIDKNTHNY